jgi:hypothetical protein
MFKKDMFDDCPTVLALLRRDVPRPATLPEQFEGVPRWVTVSDAEWDGDDGRHFTCAMGLHPGATSACPYDEGEFPAPVSEICRTGVRWDRLKKEEYQDAIDEIWPLGAAKHV